MKHYFITDEKGLILYIDSFLEKEYELKKGDYINKDSPIFPLIVDTYYGRNKYHISENNNKDFYLFAAVTIYNNKKAVLIISSYELMYKKIASEEKERKKAITNLIIFWRKINKEENIEQKLKFALNAAEKMGWGKLVLYYNWNNKYYSSFSGYSIKEKNEIKKMIPKDLPNKLEEETTEMLLRDGIFYVVPGYKKFDKIFKKDKLKYWNYNYLIVITLKRRKSQLAGWLMIDDPMIDINPAKEEFMTMVGFFHLVVSEIDNYQSSIEILNLQNEKETLLHEIAHDLKSPLSVIRGYTDALLSGNIDKERKRKFLKGIENKTIRISSMIQQILELAKLQNIEKLLTLENCDIKKIVSEAFLSQSDFAIQRNIDIKLSFTKNDVFIKGDRKYLKRAIVNLINNAIKFSTNEDIVKITLYIEENMCKISIKDNGIGILKGNIKKIFKKFYRVNNINNYPGTGLGLSLVRRIVHLHDGEIGVESTQGNGSTFIISLPINN